MCLCVYKDKVCDFVFMTDFVLIAGRDGLTHNMLNEIHNHWKFTEAIRIKCMGVPTVDMKNIVSQLEVYAFLYSFKHLTTLPSKENFLL